ncbi:MAG: sensor histidine kinase [Sphingomicrobium sp.]|nr:hypothetical protein [Sphingomonadales bacterium]
MKFDDRLATVLAAPVANAHDRAVRWRQLVDLIARAGADAAGSMIDAALAAVAQGRSEVAESLRAAAARAIAGRALPPALLDAFAADTLEVAAPLLTGEPPSDRLRSAASPEVRRFLDALHPQDGASSQPQPDAGPRPQPSEPAPQPPPRLTEGVPSIGEVVARIEQLRAARALGGEESPAVAAVATPAQSPPPSTASRPPTVPSPAEQSNIDQGSPALFRWECGPGGEIGWVDGAPRGPLVGRSIARANAGEGVDREVERAFARRSPFRDATLALPDAGIVAGQWLISGVPAFAPTDGRFVGYRGIARRAEVLAPSAMVSAPASLDSAALRELVHEIKTPLNAIIGFAEIIDGQYLGPAHSGYRARAAEIVAQARALLGAVDDLDFAARLRASDGESEPVELAEIILPIAERLRDAAQARGVTLAIDSPPRVGQSALAPQLVARLFERFVEAVVTGALADETLRLAIRQEEEFTALRLSRPRALEGLSTEELFGLNGSGLSLRLIAGLAQIVGSKLEADGSDLVLRMPLAA